MRKVLLVILDGWGHSDFTGEPTEGNAVELADGSDVSTSL